MRVRCPTCKKELVWENAPFRPFCSKRCKLVDLGRWLGEEYRIPAAEDEGETLTDEEAPRTVRDRGPNPDTRRH